MLRTLPRLLPILAVLTAACSAGGSGGSPYTIGAAGPWQLSHGRNTRLGIELALKEINDSGGVNGHKLVVKEADDHADGATAAQVAQKFVDDKSISAVVGHVTSGAMVAAVQVYDGHLVAVATSASSPELTGISKWAFRIISSDSANGADIAKFAMRTGHKRAAILYENDSYGRGLADAFRKSFDGQIIDIDPIRSDAANHEVFISYFKQKQPDVVFIAGVIGSALPMLAEAKKQGLKADLIGGDGWSPITEHPEVSEGAYIGAPFAPTDPRPEAQKFVAAFKAANKGLEPDGNAALGYDATRVIAAALAAVGPDRNKIRDWLANLSIPVAGVTGPIRFLPSGDPAGKSITMTRVGKDGSLIVLSASK
ncbi:MAG TPA: branched-chain amino acid ABC transporter substrate-binding protein [Gemmatimonadaceae bacterium]|jgi:branched-chain amino acid transport system substrate-binding protein|nr:branched-chain amino acid ABC transporter substrate-binding protein [Gemmatimonadaceae bacterium]